jgi:Fe-S cluster biogenesis protein NfuA
MPPTASNVTIKSPADAAIETAPPENVQRGNAQNENVRERVQSVINLIRPAVQADGGDIELVDVTPAGVVQIRFHGACHGCPSSTMTLHMGIERNLREKVPEITQVVSVP